MTFECDQEVLALQIGRPLRAHSVVLERCCLGLPIVAEVPPILNTGEPFPTRYWLTCPLARRRIARLEGGGGVRAMQAEVESNQAFGDAMAAVHVRYALERDRTLPSDAVHRPSGGVGGSSGGVKCLHAHYADFIAGNANPVGEKVSASIGELRCTVPCVTRIDCGQARNPDWREP